jgi:hypothetical protein
MRVGMLEGCSVVGRERRRSEMGMDWGKEVDLI